ncbi:TPA: terminase [Salmonella enterica]
MDMEALKSDYCAGVLSIQKVADKHGVSKSTLIDWAKKYGWIRKKRSKKNPSKIPSKKSDQNSNGRTDGRTKKNAGKTSSDKDYDDDDVADDSDENCTNSAETKRNNRSGNPHPVCRFVERNTAAVKHRGYARYLEKDYLFDDAAEMDLIDELVFTRARALSVTATLNRMFTELDKTEDILARTGLYGKILQAETALDRNIARIESIERTLGTLDIIAVTPAKIIADTEYRAAAREKVKAETDILTSQKQGVTTPMNKIVQELHRMNHSGRLDDIPEE